MDQRRLIEVAFPLKQASLDSVHEKNVRHGHISTLHIWPARRPLAACRAALIATLLPDPGTPEKRKEILEKLGGKVIETVEKKKMPSGKVVERVKEETVGGILHWGRESGPDLQWFRDEIRKAYGGRAPKVLDPFAGGGAIPLEAMRLGCEVTASDINPVAWFILKCTLEYPQKLAGQKRPLPDFILKDREFMEAFFKSQGLKGAKLRTQLHKLGLVEGEVNMALPGAVAILDADLAWHVRAWGKWVLNRARAELARFYPTYADFEPVAPPSPAAPRGPMPAGTPALQAGAGGDAGATRRLVPNKPDGTPDIDALNKEFGAEYLKDKRKPRWVAKPTVAYLWARTVTCKNCRATIPLLKTRWLCKKDNKRVLLAMEPNAKRTGVSFGIRDEVQVVGANAAQRREHDRLIAAGTMTRAGVTCPCCRQPSMTMGDLRLEGRDGRIGVVMTAVMIETEESRRYRSPTPHEIEVVSEVPTAVDNLFVQLPHGKLCEPLRPASTRSISCDLYGIDSYAAVFTSRQQLALGTFIRETRRLGSELGGLPPGWRDAIFDLLGLNIDRVADRCSTFCRPDPTPTQSGIINTFSRFALPMTWDFIEGVPIANSSGGYIHSLEWIARVVEHLTATIPAGVEGVARRQSSTTVDALGEFDLIMTDPPYYEAISYGDLSDFFYVWQRRLHDDLAEFGGLLTDKTEEAVQHVRSDKKRSDERLKYERMMAASFGAAFRCLSDFGRFVCVFAHKQPDAWESLVSAMIRAGFVVDASWPIQTEMGNRTRALASAALSSSVWLVCKKRDEAARPGWDDTVLKEMRANIYARLREFWDAGIRGPDFVWAATGPALEAYSKYPVVKKANDPGKLMEVSEFLRQVRRIVVDFVVGRVLSHNGGTEGASGLDDVTTYYLLHRNDFKTGDAPAGACILYAISCNLSDSALADQYEILVRTGGQAAADEEEEETEAADEEPQEMSEGTGSTFRLLAWNQRRSRNLGEGTDGRPAPLIDQIHRLMQLWKAGDQVRVDEFLDAKGLRASQRFHQVLQALIELSEAGGTERSLLEAISNHVTGAGPSIKQAQYKLL